MKKASLFWILSLSVLAVATVLALVNRTFEIQILARTYAIMDDSFYYYQVAYNIIRDRGVSFDGIHATNGFHPLWLCFLLPIVAIFDKDHVIMPIFLLQGAFFFFALVAGLFILLRSKVQPLIGLLLITALAFVPLYLRTSFWGLEVAISVLFIALTVIALDKLIQAKNSVATAPALILGVLAAFMNLSRTDSILFSMLIFLFLTYEKRWKELLIFCIPLALLVLPFLATNYIVFGEVMQVSGAAKRAYAMQSLDRLATASGESHLELSIKNLVWPLTTGAPIYFYVVIINLFGIAFYLIRRQKALALFQLFLVAKYVMYAVLYFDHCIYPWYYAVDLFGVALLLGIILSSLHSLSPIYYSSYLRWLGRLIAYASLLVVGKATWTNAVTERASWKYQQDIFQKDPRPGNELQQFYLAARIIRDISLPDSFIFGMRNSGVFGFYSNKTVVNLDGLINDEVRLAYIKKYGQNFGPYIDEIQPIDAYIDEIGIAAKSAYDRDMFSRGFVELGLGAVIEKLYGRSTYADIGGVRLYVKRDKAHLFPFAVIGPVISTEAVPIVPKL